MACGSRHVEQYKELRLIRHIFQGVHTMRSVWNLDVAQLWVSCQKGGLGHHLEIWSSLYSNDSKFCKELKYAISFLVGVVKFRSISRSGIWYVR